MKTSTLTSNKAFFLCEYLSDGIVVVDSSLKKIVFINQIASEFLKVKGTKAQDLNCLLKKIKISALLRSGGMIVDGISYTVQIIKKEEVWILIKKVENTKDLEKRVLLNIAHEFKKPLTVLLGHLELLPKLKGSKRNESISEMMKSTYELDNYLKSLLFLESPQIPFSFSDPVEIIHKAKTRIISLYPRFQIRILKKVPKILICVNANLLEIALYNILENAVKYSSFQKSITIDVIKTKKWMQITVQDQGQGIKKEHLNKIFDEFFSCDQTLSFQKGGCGWGLSLVKSIMDKHQGKIEVESIPGKGTKFILSLPLIR